jgi:hypothetical protein
MVFTELIQPSETVREVMRRHPETREVFDQAGIRACCYDCAIRTAALRGGIDLSGLLMALDEAVQGRWQVCHG